MDSPDCAVVKDTPLNPEAIWLGESLHRNRHHCYDVNIGQACLMNTRKHGHTRHT